MQERILYMDGMGNIETLQKKKTCSTQVQMMSRKSNRKFCDYEKKCGTVTTCYVLKFYASIGSIWVMDILHINRFRIPYINNIKPWFAFQAISRAWMSMVFMVHPLHPSQVCGYLMNQHLCLRFWTFHVHNFTTKFFRYPTHSPTRPNSQAVPDYIHIPCTCPCHERMGPLVSM